MTAKIVFIQPDAQAVEVAAKPGGNIMRAGLSHQVQGILAECSGSMAMAARSGCA